MIHFYGSPNSSAGRTHWALEEVSVPYEYHRVNLRDPASKTALLKVNPGGRVPAIDDDGFFLFESLAINDYLAERYKPELLGEDAKERALVRQWSAWTLTNLEPDVLAIMMHGALLPELERNAKILESAKARVHPLLGQLEQALGHGEYLVGKRFTLADLNTASIVNLAQRLGSLSPAYAHAGAWLERMRARAAYGRAVAGA